MKCTDCETPVTSETATIYSGRNHNGVPIIYAGCDFCSNTLWAVDADNFAAHLDPAEATRIANLVGAYRPRQIAEG